MSKTLLVAAFLGLPLLTWVAAPPVFSAVRAAEQIAPEQVASDHMAPDQIAPGGLNALDGRRFAAPAPAPAESGGFAADPPAFWNPGANGGERESADGAGRSGLDLGAFSGAPAQAPDALPLSQFAGADARAAAAVHPGVWDFVNRVRYGGLPEPASWALIVIGFGMIGGAVRGFVVANRRLARLQPDEEPE